MAWIESHQSLRDHPKTKRLARLLGVPKVTAIGYLHLLWWWAMEYAQDGDLSSFTAEDVADAVEWEGDAARFWAALHGAGFVDDGDVLHDWTDYAGRLIEHRAHAASRARRNRGLYNDDELVRAVRARDGDVCRYCGEQVDWRDRRGLKGGTYDHVDPDAVPENTPENVVVACRSCNAAKGRRTPEEAGMHLIPAGSGKSTAENLPYPNKKPAVNLPTVNQTEPNRNHAAAATSIPPARTPARAREAPSPPPSMYCTELNGLYDEVRDSFRSLRPSEFTEEWFRRTLAELEPEVGPLSRTQLRRGLGSAFEAVRDALLAEERGGKRIGAKRPWAKTVIAGRLKEYQA